MPSSKPRARRARGNVSWLPSGSARVTVYGGIDQLTDAAVAAVLRRHGHDPWTQLCETVAARDTERETEKEAERARTKLLDKVDERRARRAGATVEELLDGWLDVLDIEKTIRRLRREDRQVHPADI